MFNPTYDEAFLSDYRRIANIPDKSLRQLFAVIYILLKKDPKAVQTTIPAEELDAREDKKKVMTDALFRKVAEFVGINDPADGPLVLVYVFIGECLYYAVYASRHIVCLRAQHAECTWSGS